MRIRQRIRTIIVGCVLLWPTLLWADELRLSALPSAPYPSANAVTSGDADLIHALARQHTTPKAVGAWLRREFTFRRDQDIFGEEEHWQAPREFLARKIGDCEDYALLARELLVRNGIEAYVFSLFGDEGYAHTVCIFIEDGRYNVLNQDNVRYYRATTLEALAAQMYPAWTFGGIVEQAGTRGRLVQEITNPRPAQAAASLGELPVSGRNRAR